MCTTVKSIDSKSGTLSDLHLDIIGCECSILQMPFGKDVTRLLITVPISKTGVSRHVMTSEILKYRQEESRINVETENSRYIFQM